MKSGSVQYLRRISDAVLRFDKLCGQMITDHTGSGTLDEWAKVVTLAQEIRDVIGVEGKQRRKHAADEEEASPS